MEWVEAAFTRTPCTPWGGEMRASVSANDAMRRWGICSKGNEERGFIPWSGEEEGKVKCDVLGEWENFCCIDRNEGVRRDPVCGEVSGGLVRHL